MSFDHTYPTRKAIVICSPGGHKTSFLPGVECDSYNVPKFLQSEKGGVWQKNEIQILYDPTFREVKQTIQNSIADYCIVYFSGHGYTDRKTETRMLCLKDYTISDRDLLNDSLRQLVLIDACRNYSGSAISGIPDFKPQWYNFTGSPVRKLFDNYIKNSLPGRMIIHGTQEGKFSSDSLTGGMFTNALLNVSTRIKAVQGYTQASVQQILNYVPQILQKQGNNQIPNIAYQTGNLTIPFAIGIPKSNYSNSLLKIPQRKPVISDSSSSNAGLALMGLGLLIFGIVATSNSKQRA